MPSNFRNAVADRGAMRADLWRFGDDGTIDMVDDAPRSRNKRGGVGEEQMRRRALPARIGRREMLADIAEAGGAEQSVGDGVKRDVGVAVAGKAALVGDRDAAEHDWPIAGKGVDVEAHASARNQCSGDPLLGTAEILRGGDLVEFGIAFDQGDPHPGRPQDAWSRRSAAAPVHEA